MSGGFCFGYADEKVRYRARAVLALINDRPVYVTEARFGGTVAQPMTEGLRTKKDPKIVDLTRLLVHQPEMIVWDG